MTTEPTHGLPHEDANDDLVFVLEAEPEGWEESAASDWGTTGTAPSGPAAHGHLDPVASLPAPVSAAGAPAPTAASAPAAHPWSESVPPAAPSPATPVQAAAPAPVPHPSQHVPALTPVGLSDASSHASIVHRGGVYEITLDGLRLASEVNIVLATNRLANEAMRRQTRIIANVKDLRTRYYRQFNADGTSDDVAPPVPPEANLGVPFHASADLSYQPDGGASQEEWVADSILTDDEVDAAPAVDSGFLAGLRDRLRRA